MDGARVRYVFLDRDGVINRKLPEGAWVTDWAQFAWLPGAVEAIACMVRAGYRVMVVTNQRGVSLERYTVAQLEMIHHRMQAFLEEHGAALSAIYYCPHDRDQCRCRKPDVGMLEQAFTDFPAANAHNSVLIGDSLSDVQAGKRMGMQTIFIQNAADGRKADASDAAELADEVAGSLLEAVQTYLPH